MPTLVYHRQPIVGAFTAEKTAGLRRPRRNHRRCRIAGQELKVPGDPLPNPLGVFHRAFAGSSLPDDLRGCLEHQRSDHRVQLESVRPTGLAARLASVATDVTVVLGERGHRPHQFAERRTLRGLCSVQFADAGRPTPFAAHNSMDAWSVPERGTSSQGLFRCFRRAQCSPVATCTPVAIPLHVAAGRRARRPHVPAKPASEDLGQDSRDA